MQHPSESRFAVSQKGFAPVGALLLIAIIVAAVWFVKKGKKADAHDGLDLKLFQSGAVTKQPNASGVEFSSDGTSKSQAQKYYRDHR